jgi:hypothetical protein
MCHQSDHPILMVNRESKVYKLERGCRIVRERLDDKVVAFEISMGDTTGVAFTHRLRTLDKEPTDNLKR